MVVEEINIFTTVFVGSDKRKIILPNNILATKAIHNFRRSPDLEDFIDFFIQVDTSDLNILEIKRRVHKYVLTLKDLSPLFMHIYCYISYLMS
jgi:small-conductance mechanosensitive channel